METISETPKASLYLETSVISYLTARLSQNLIVAAQQQITQDWWTTKRQQFILYTSQVVIKEASFGDPVVAQTRLAILQPLPLLTIDEECLALANALLNAKAVPRKVEDDALHIALATTNGVDYLLTWNFKHIANAVMQTKINQVCRDLGYKLPVICTPQALMGDQDVA